MDNGREAPFLVPFGNDSKGFVVKDVVYVGAEVNGVVVSINRPLTKPIGSDVLVETLLIPPALDC